MNWKQTVFAFVFAACDGPYYSPAIVCTCRSNATDRHTDA